MQANGITARCINKGWNDKYNVCFVGSLLRWMVWHLMKTTQFRIEWEIRLGTSSSSKVDGASFSSFIIQRNRIEELDCDFNYSEKWRVWVCICANATINVSNQCWSAIEVSIRNWYQMLNDSSMLYSTNKWGRLSTGCGIYTEPVSVSYIEGVQPFWNFAKRKLQA